MAEALFGQLIALAPDVTPANIPLDRVRTVIGRLPGVCDVVVDRRSVSRIHAEIERRGSHFVLVNRSRFSTFVNGEPVTGERILFHGDRIGLALPEPMLQFRDEGETFLETGIPERRLRYDARTFTFSLDGESLVLTPQQLTLLHFLYEHAGAVCTREECEQAVWGENPVVEMSALHRLISDLRAVLRAADPDADLIQTRRGVGYILALGA